MHMGKAETSARILLVEDDESLGATLAERLSREGYEPHWVKTRAEALLWCGYDVDGKRKSSPQIDLAILDVGLPDGSGLDLARDIRLVSQLPIIFLTAMSSPEYRLEGFELGAEDYIPKPFHLKELLLRIQRVLPAPEDAGAASHQRVRGDPTRGLFVLNRDAFTVTLPDRRVVQPTTRDFGLLCLLVDASPRVLSRDEIIKLLWGSESDPSPRTIDNAIVRLRQLLGGGAAEAIRSVRGIGYQFRPE